MHSFQSKNLLVTGGCGFIGSTFLRMALPRFEKIIVLDALTYAGHRENIAELLDGPSGQGAAKGERGAKLQLIEGDICNQDLVLQLLRDHSIDTLVHFAAESHVDRSISGPRAFLETNVGGTFSLLSASLEYSKSTAKTASGNRNGLAPFKYIQVSTDEVYGSLGPTGYFHEKHPFEPNSPYSASKAAADHFVRAWHHTYGMHTITTHCSNNYGPRQFPEKLIPHMIRCALEGKKLPVYGDGGNIRDWIHVEDHSQGILLAIEKGRPGATYCFGGRAERNNLEVVQKICAHLDELRPLPGGAKYASQIGFVEDRLGHDRRYAIDDSLAESELQFVRKYRSFEEGLRQTIQWYLANNAWCDAVTAQAQRKLSIVSQKKGVLR